MTNIRYARQELLLPFKDKSALLNAKRVGIVGLGGLGGLCSYLLLGAGVLNLNLSDGDVVEISNLHRQILFNEQYVGTEKKEAIKEELLKLDSRACITLFDKINADNFALFADKCDLILDLSDNIETRLLISKLCLNAKKDFLHVSVAAFTGLLMAMQYSSSSFVEKHGCYQCVTGEIDSLPLQGITGPSASIMASYAAQMALQMLLGNFENAGYLYKFSLKDFATLKMLLVRDHTCSVCKGVCTCK